MEKKTNTKSKLEELKTLLNNDESSMYKKDNARQPSKIKLAALNDQHLLFIQEYLLCNNQEQAAIKAGYAQKSAKSKASQLMADPLIQKEIEKQRNKIQQKWEIDRDFIINEYMNQIIYSKDIKLDGTDTVKDSNLWLKATQALSKTLGLDMPAKIDITSQGQPINIQYIIPDINKTEDNDNE